MEEEESMASSSGNENNQNMVDSAKAAEVKIIPYENTIDGVLDVLRSQLHYVEPPYYGPGSDYMVEDPVSDTDDPNVKSVVVGDHRKKSLPRAIDTKWGRIVHEYELELARTGKQGFLMPQNLGERLLQINHEYKSELARTDKQ
ncbi:hypothetical protein MKX03_017438, partial [Papaver bracteatum]